MAAQSPSEDLSTAQSPTSAGTAWPDAWRVEVFRGPTFDDPEGRRLVDAARELDPERFGRLTDARAGQGYLLPAALERSTVERIVHELLADPVIDVARLTAPRQGPSVPPAVRRALVAKKPGVMDPVAQTVRRALERTGVAIEGPVQTFRAWELVGELTENDLAELGRRVLANETVDTLLVDSEALGYGALGARMRHVRSDVPLREATDAELDAISKDGGLSLTTLEMRAIQGHYVELGREPSIAELETIAQTWSEHCKHKTFAGIIEMDGETIDNLLKQTIKRATDELAKPWCVSVFHDNAGIIEFDQGYDVAFKVETHNHPSAIDPYGGAGTGIGGVIRDILGVGLGAKPIANTDSFFVGPTDLAASELPKGVLHPARILRGVVAGVRDYGNRMGIPTVDGGVWFHEGYVANPLVYAGTVGILPHECAEKEIHAGDVILLVGGRTGLDGIHGATFSSAELDETSETTAAAAVQIGDPITEKKVLDALLVARDKKLYRGLTDCGAGGLSSAVGEMAEGLGAEVDLELVPLKYEGLCPEEIWISEAQERMVLAVPPESLDACRKVFLDEDVDATAIGRFTDSGQLVLRYDGETVGDLDLVFLHEGTPRPVRQASWSPPELDDPGCPAVGNPTEAAATLRALLGSPDIASKEWLIRQYDHEVQGLSVAKGLVGPAADGPGNGAVLQPLPQSARGIALGCGANPRYGLADPGAMAEAVIDEALRNVVALGGDPEHTAILDNFSWGNCEKPDRLGALVHAAQGCYRAAVAYGTPFISGKDSLNNEYKVGGESLAIPPTLLVSSLSIVPDVAQTVTMDFKRPGSWIFQVGETDAELGGSHYLAHKALAGGRVPRPDLLRAPALLRALHKAIASGLVLSCHDLSEGGLAVAVAESAFAGSLGASIDLDRVPVREGRDGFDEDEGFGKGYDPDATRLFSESCTRFLVEVADEHATTFESELAGHACTAIGQVTGDPVVTLRGTAGDEILRVPVDELRAAFSSGFAG